MRPIWKPYISWSECGVLTRKMGELQDAIVKDLSNGKQESGILHTDDRIRVAMIELQQAIERIKLKDDTTRRD